MIVSIAALGFVTIPDDPSRMSVMVNVKLPTVFSGVDALSTALGVVLVLMVAPATIYRFVATRPDTVPAVDDELLVMAFNNENGYDTDGNFNGHCFAEAVRDTAADFVSVPEGDAMVRKVSSLASLLHSARALVSSCKSADEKERWWCRSTSTRRTATRWSGSPPTSAVSAAPSPLLTHLP